jgi:hypothetical protein
MSRAAMLVLIVSGFCPYSYAADSPPEADIVVLAPRLHWDCGTQYYTDVMALSIPSVTCDTPLFEKGEGVCMNRRPVV